MATQSVDELFYEYQRSKFELLEDISPENIRKFIFPDSECMRKMGKHDGESEYSCTKCLQIGRLTNMRRNVPSDMKIEIGKNQGITYGITESNNALFGCKYDSEAENRFNRINSIENLSECGLSGIIRADKYICSDYWLNEILISWYLEKIFREAEIPHLNPVVIGYVCGNSGYTIDYDGIRPLRDLKDLSEDDALSILLQLGAIFLCLKKHKFIHGTCTIDKIGFTDVPCGYQYQGQNIVGRFTLYIRGFHLSSINIGRTRLIPSTRGRDVDLDYAVSQFKPVISKCKLTKISIGEDYDQVCGDGDLLYLYNDSGPTLFTTMRYSGFPVFGGSYDLYSIIVSLLSWEPFRSAIKKSEKLTAIIRRIFPGNLPEIKEDEITCSYKIAMTLSNVWLYCSAIDKLFENINKYK